MDIYLALDHPGFPRTIPGLYIDLGFGETPPTTLETTERLRKINPQIRFVGVEIDPKRVAAALPLRTSGTDFRVGGFNLPLQEGEQAAVIRRDPQMKITAFFKKRKAYHSGTPFKLHIELSFFPFCGLCLPLLQHFFFHLAPESYRGGNSRLLGWEEMNIEPLIVNLPLESIIDAHHGHDGAPFIPLGIGDTHPIHARFIVALRLSAEWGRVPVRTGGFFSILLHGEPRRSNPFVMIENPFSEKQRARFDLVWNVPRLAPRFCGSTAGLKPGPSAARFYSATVLGAAGSSAASPPT